MAKAPTGIDLARALCSAHPKATSHSLAKRLYKENVERFPTYNAAYLCVRRARGNQGVKMRNDCKDTETRRENGKTGWVPECPSTHTEPDMFKNDTTCWSTGCLCDMTPEYARLNKWSHGFCFVEVAADGTFGVHNYQITRDGAVRPA